MADTSSFAGQPLSRTLAYQIITGFDKFYRKFCNITANAKTRFEQSQWQQSISANKERIDIYEHYLSDTVINAYQFIHPHQQTSDFWLQSKQQFSTLLALHPQFELAETFYNSVIGRIFKHSKIDDKIMFVDASRCHLSGPNRHRVINSFDTTKTVRSLFEEIFNTYTFKVPFNNLALDLHNMDNALRQRFNAYELASVTSVEILKPIFYRGKAAYLVGRICMPNAKLPFVIALHMTELKTIVVDAILTQRQNLSVLFSFARSYFMADTQHPNEVVAFLKELLPHKKSFELYMSLGLYKHGKTVFYRNYLEHLAKSQNSFELAPGIKGLVMAVFHLPSYNVVFKVIKDEFAESKKITREHVKDCYRLVKTTDRVGRMADTHEYVNFRFPKNRFCPILLNYLHNTCRSSIDVCDNEIIIKHLYIERKMTPLNLFFEQESDAHKIRAAIDDLGLCIKQIALANIFPGDMLHKNFGITETGRVIFYDYDEISYMNERNFRQLPKSNDPFALDTLSIGPTDVFPEQFEHFIVGKKALKALLKELHPELMQANYWNNVQKIAAKGYIQDFTPYPAALRFARGESA